MLNYSDKLKNPLWQRKRLEVLQRDSFTCTLCMDCRTTLNIHHEQYQGDPWEISNDHLKTVCAHCHDIIHHIEGCNVLAVKKKISINRKCWECVVFTDAQVFFLYMFFVENQEHFGKVETITITTNLTTIAA